ncbi:protein of unknown function [Nitrospira japonica]|uniref:Uncharacterized protein n=1 Tax=Nitrospira japonica TaxID=1325564 RepID=A0A1W1I8V6_9BACT|nr:protein of unknown function [Nitrospira japonica]
MMLARKLACPFEKPHNDVFSFSLHSNATHPTWRILCYRVLESYGSRQRLFTSSSESALAFTWVRREITS